MSEESKIDPKHNASRFILRVLGPTIAGIGMLLIIVGVASFFSAFGSFEPPRYFWCTFVGMPLLFVGVAMSMFGFFGAFARYVFGEAAPVHKDTFNYLAEGTKQGVRTIATAVGEGFAAGRAAVFCQQCGKGNESDAKFCKNCGAAIVK